MAYETIPGAGDPGQPLNATEADAVAAFANVDSIDVPSGEVVMSDDASDAVFARDLTMNDSAAATADVVGDLSAVDSAIALANVQGSARIVESAVMAVAGGGPVELEGGWAGVVVSPEFTVRDGGTVLMTQREAIIFAAVFAGVLLVGGVVLSMIFGRD